MTTNDKPKTRPYPTFGYPTPPKVGRDPTQAMINAGMSAGIDAGLIEAFDDTLSGDIANLWRAMYDAGMKKE